MKSPMPSRITKSFVNMSEVVPNGNKADSRFPLNWGKAQQRIAPADLKLFIVWCRLIDKDWVDRTANCSKEFVTQMGLRSVRCAARRNSQIRVNFPIVLDISTDRVDANWHV